MQSINRRLATIVLCGLAIGASASIAMAGYPDKPIRLLVGFPAGGSSDAMARIVAPLLEKRLGQPIVIENRPGAGAMIAIDAVSKSAPDGYVIGLGGVGALGTNVGPGDKMPYDPQKDIVPVTALAGSPFILAAAPSFPGKSLSDVLAMARAPGTTLSLGHGGNGTLMHLTSEMINQVAGTNLALVPYKGMAPVVNDLAGGHVPLGIVDPPSAIAAIEANKIKVIAITSANRFGRMPDVPTFAESGLPGFESNGWFGIFAPGGTPPDVVAKLNDAFVAALKDPDVIAKIRALGSEPMPMTLSEYKAFIDSEMNKWMKVVKAAAGKTN